MLGFIESMMHYRLIDVDTLVIKINDINVNISAEKLKYALTFFKRIGISKLTFHFREDFRHLYISEKKCNITELENTFVLLATKTASEDITCLFAYNVNTNNVEFSNH